MSRPCFALSVLLSFLAGPLLLVGKTQAGDDIVSSSHDPGECIVCPLAFGPDEVCGGYSDYDYNHYWYGPSAKPNVTPTDPELAVAEQLLDNEVDQSWQSDYEDYYADYVFTDSEGESSSDEGLPSDSTTDEGSGEPEASVVETSDETAVAPRASTVDEYGWFSDDALAPEDYFKSYEDYQPIVADDESTASNPEGSNSKDIADHNAYEDEWFSYGEETSVDVPDTAEPEVDEAYEALSTADDQSFSYADDPSNYETWGDEEEWYREEYGAETDSPPVAGDNDGTAVVDERLATGYDSDYDTAIATESGNTSDTTAAAAKTADDPSYDYESFYDAYDDLYNFEEQDSPFSETDEAAADAATNPAAPSVSPPGPVSLTKPQWLKDLVAQMMSPAWESEEVVALNAPMVASNASEPADFDECSQYWDCEADYWANQEPEAPSVVLEAAETLDGMAAMLQDAADLLRDFAESSIVKTAQSKMGMSPR